MRKAKRNERREKGRAGRGKRDSLPATGGKDLGKLKGVAIDYLTGDDHEADFGSRCDPGPAMGAGPSPACRTKRQQARIHEQKREGQWTLQTHGTRTHARTHARGPSAFVPGRSLPLSSVLSPIFLHPYRGTRYERWTKFRHFVENEEELYSRSNENESRLRQVKESHCSR